ncbi:MAG: NADH-quinone oxidoreductase subunit D [Solitalea-like symbiont of Acarus siro]
MYHKHINLGSENIVKKTTTLNLGPTHPATHGIFQNVLEMNGEQVISTEQTIGYIHRAFEKIAERRPFYQITSLTDRLNYCSAPINNMGWHMTVEKLIGITIPKRVQYLRVIIMELARIIDHLICNSIIAVDAGAFSTFLYIYQQREKVYEIYEEICGGRLTTNIGRIGGFERNFNERSFAKLKTFLKDFPKVLDEFESLLDRNKIFIDRCRNIGIITAEDALANSVTGPMLRAAGVDYDVRVVDPYCSYEDFNFVIPVGTKGDTFDRYLVRNEEMKQSLLIIHQALDKISGMPEDVFSAQVPDYCLPPKEELTYSMEALIYHFKIVMGEIKVPVSELYFAVEGANGELGFYVQSDGGRTPYRLHFRRPCFINYQVFPIMIKGLLLSDVILTLSSLNVIAGELDA